MDSAAAFARALAVLKAGGVVACPTETWMGLLADALDPHAVARVVDVKGRDANNPMGLLLPDADALTRVARQVPARGVELARAHWPGPLTLVVWGREDLPAPLLKDGKVGVRVPGASAALDLVRAFGGPLTATSANRTGQPAARTASEARAIFGDELGAIVPGESPGGQPSTVLDVTGAVPVVIRAGAIVIP